MYFDLSFAILDLLGSFLYLFISFSFSLFFFLGGGGGWVVLIQVVDACDLT